MSKLTLITKQRRYPVDSGDLANADIVALSNDKFHLLHKGRAYTAEVEQIDLPSKQVSLRIGGQRLHFSVEDEVDALVRELGLGVAESAVTKNVSAPMPGLVLEVLVATGQEVEAGDKLLVLEAMKMENSLSAPAAGTVQEVRVNTGDAVDKLQLLIEIA